MSFLPDIRSLERNIVRRKIELDLFNSMLRFVGKQLTLQEAIDSIKPVQDEITDILQQLIEKVNEEDDGSITYFKVESLNNPDMMIIREVMEEPVNTLSYNIYIQNMGHDELIPFMFSYERKWTD